jgi:hypothetical protein
VGHGSPIRRVRVLRAKSSLMSVRTAWSDKGLAFARIVASSDSSLIFSSTILRDAFRDFDRFQRLEHNADTDHWAIIPPPCFLPFGRPGSSLCVRVNLETTYSPQAFRADVPGRSDYTPHTEPQRLRSGMLQERRWRRSKAFRDALHTPRERRGRLRTVAPCVDACYVLLAAWVQTRRTVKRIVQYYESLT